MSIYKGKPEHGHKRLKRNFLLFPKTINGDRRWLSRQEWIEEFRVNTWVSIKWADFTLEVE